MTTDPRIAALAAALANQQIPDSAILKNTTIGEVRDEIARLRAIEEAARKACDSAYRDRADPETMDALRAALAAKEATDERA